MMGMSYVLGMWDIIIDTLLSLVAQYIMFGVWFVFGYGTLAAVYSIVGICREQLELEEQPVFEEMGKHIGKPKDVHHIKWLDFEMRPQHLEKSTRLHPAGDERKAKNKGKIPLLLTLRDLHELTLYRETHRSSSAALTMSISVLLISGICGTMLKVHAALGGGVNIFADLGHALEPAYYAVFFTIILLILRGIYMALVACYIADLDKYIYEKGNTTKTQPVEVQKLQDPDVTSFCSDATEEIMKTGKCIESSSRKHRKDTEIWSKFSFPVYDASRQNHTEESPPTLD